MNNKVALITGSSRGIGRSIAISLAKKGCNIIINYITNLESANSLNDELKKYNIETMIIKCDMSNEEEIKNMVEKSLEKFGKIDYLVNNAAFCLDTIYQDKTKDNFIKTLDVNLVGPFLLSRLVADVMYSNKFGKIVNISSTNGIDTYYEESLDYDASKAGLISLTHNLSKHYAPYINVNCVCPGWVDTDMNKNLDDEFIKDECKKIYINRFAFPDEITAVVTFLLSDEASYVNNSIIRVDGGYDHE